MPDSYFFPCGKCLDCRSGNAIDCRYTFARWLVPCDRPPHFTGAFAEYYYASPGHYIVKVPDRLSDEMVAPVNCALCQVMYGLHRAGVNLGDTVVIQGAGGLGLNAIAVAKEMGAGQVIVFDKLKERLALARKFGADHTIDVSEIQSSRDRVQAVKDLTGGRGAELVVELTGSPKVIPEGIRLLARSFARHSTYLVMGSISPGQTADFDPQALMRVNGRIMALGGYEPWMISKALSFLNRCKDKYPFDQIVHRFRLDEINEAFTQANAGKVTRAAIAP